MNYNPTDEESMAYLTIANATLLTSLFNNGFLNSNYYEGMEWRTAPRNLPIIKSVLEQRGLDNPAMMFMLLYSLLVMPKELLGDEFENLCKQDFNAMVVQMQKTVETTYHNESPNNIERINFLRHIRNAVSHAGYEFYTQDSNNYVKFKDKIPDTNQLFSVVILTEDISVLTDYLCNQLMKFVNDRIKQHRSNQN